MRLFDETQRGEIQAQTTFESGVDHVSSGNLITKLLIMTLEKDLDLTKIRSQLFGVCLNKGVVSVQVLIFCTKINYAALPQQHSSESVYTSRLHLLQLTPEKCATKLQL